MLDSAILQYEKALDLKSKYWQALYKMGYAYYRQGKLEQAEKTFQKGLEVKERGEFYNGLGLVQMAKGKLKEADLSFRTAISHDEKNAEFHKNLGDVNFKKGVLVIAIQSYQKALELDSTLVGPHYNMGQAYLKQMDFNQAAEEFKTVIKLDPKHQDAYLALGDIYMLDRKHYPEARVIYEEYLKFDQENAKVFLFPDLNTMEFIFFPKYAQLIVLVLYVKLHLQLHGLHAGCLFKYTVLVGQIGIVVFKGFLVLILLLIIFRQVQIDLQNQFLKHEFLGQWEGPGQIPVSFIQVSSVYKYLTQIQI